MKKNFFKKLSFVLASAMLVSAIAPAAGAFAASDDLKLNSTKKYLHISGISGPSDYNFNIVGDKQKGWSYDWSSEKKGVATVEKNGVVTAVGVGSTKVSVVIEDKDGEEVDTLTATVVVRDNIETVAVAHKPEKDTVSVGKEWDFNRTFTTESGSTEKTGSVTRWTVDKTDKASITDAGVFKATEAGEYKVTAVSFQSKEKYEAWKTDSTKYAAYLLDSDEYTVKAVASIVATTQVDSDTFKVEFDSDMKNTDVAKTAVLYQVIGGKNVATGTEKIKALTLDATGKVATVDLYTVLNAGTTYNFVYGDLTGSFTAAKKDITEVTKVVFNDFNVVTNKADNMLDSVSLLNKDDVVIYKGDEAVASGYLTFTYGGDLTKGGVFGNEIYIYTLGYQAPVTVKFNNYVLDKTTNTYKTVTLEDSAVATGIKDAAVTATSMQFELTKDIAAHDNASWKGNLTLAAKDSGYIIQARYYTNTKPSDFTYTANTSVFNYVSSDTSKLVINGNYVWAYAAGTVTVVVKDTAGVAIGTFDITIQPARAFASLETDTAAVVVGNNAIVGEQPTITVTAKDTMGTGIAGGALTSEFINVPAGKVKPQVSGIDVKTGDDQGKIAFKVDARNGADAGYYQLKIKVSDGSTSKEVLISVNVIDTKSTDNSKVAYWKLDANKTSVDLKANYNETVEYGVYGYNSSNVRVDQLGVGDYTIEVKKGSTVVATGTSVVPVVASTSGSAVVVTCSADTYSITAYATAQSVATNGKLAGRALDSIIGQAAFSVVNTTTKDRKMDNPTVDEDDYTTVLAAAQKAFTLVLNGKDVTDETKFVKIKFTKNNTVITADEMINTELLTPVVKGDQVFVDQITYRVTGDNGAYIDYTFDINMPISIVD